MKKNHNKALLPDNFSLRYKFAAERGVRQLEIIMKNLLLAFSFLFVVNIALAESNQHQANSVSYSGGNGASAKTAIIINGAQSEWDGVKAENKWLSDNLPGFKKISQGLFHKSNQAYDRIEVMLPNGTKREVYFDITGFFWKTLKP